jgi:hypothetical protein
MRRTSDEGTREESVAARGRGAVLLALSSPLLILLGVAAMVMRSPSARFQALPALMIGCGLLLFSWWRRRQRRSMILRVLREPGPGNP